MYFIHLIYFRLILILLRC